MLPVPFSLYIQERGWTHKQAAAFFGETQPCISNLMNGESNQFSVDKLVNMFEQAGMQVRLEVVKKLV